MAEAVDFKKFVRWPKNYESEARNGGYSDVRNCW